MRYLILFLKGILIGVAKIIPGVSGALLSISLGVYEKIMYIISNIRKVRFDDIKFLFFLMSGVCIGIAFLCGSVKWCLDNYYLPTMLLFIGLIIGGIFEILEPIKCEKFNFTYLFVFLFCFLFLIFIASLNSGILNIKGSPFVFGFLESFTTIVPGVSGTAIFMAFGWYEELLDLFQNIAIFKAPFSSFLGFGLGFLLNTFIIAKIINFLIKEYKTITLFGILGFTLASLFLMFREISFNSLSEFILGSLLLIFGIYFTRKTNIFFSKF